MSDLRISELLGRLLLGRLEWVVGMKVTEGAVGFHTFLYAFRSASDLAQLWIHMRWKVSWHPALQDQIGAAPGMGSRQIRHVLLLRLC